MESDETRIAVLVEKVGTMNVTLTKLDGKFDVMADKYAPKAAVEALDVRVSNLEVWKNRGVGALVIIQAAWAIIVYFLTGHKPG